MRSDTCRSRSGSCGSSSRCPPRQGSSPTTDVPSGGGRFALTRPDGPLPRIHKAGADDALAREARGARLAGPGIAPRVIRRERGVLVSLLVDGSPRVLRHLGRADASALGALVRRAHDRRVTATGGLPAWSSRARTHSAYARGRARDATARARGAGERDLIARALAGIVAVAPPGPGGFRLLHGDLVEDNVVWGPEGPVLVDWEFWRMGDPAEDLAYLEALNELPGRVARDVRAGYGANEGLHGRIRAWRPLVMVDAALWHRDVGDAGPVPDLLARAAAEIA